MLALSMKVCFNQSHRTPNPQASSDPAGELTGSVRKGQELSSAGVWWKAEREAAAWKDTLGTVRKTSFKGGVEPVALTAKVLIGKRCWLYGRIPNRRRLAVCR